VSGNRKKVIVTDFNFRDVEAEKQAADAGGADFSAHQCRTGDDVRAAVEGADVVVVQFAPVDAAAIALTAPGARFVRYGVGFNNIDVSEARRTGREVAYIPDYCTSEVADHTAASALALVRRLLPLDQAVRAGTWDVLASAPGILAPETMTLGFLGLGRIGRATAARLAPFGFRKVAFDPGLDESAAADLGIELMDLDQLFTSSDLLILHLPLSDATRHVVSRNRLAQMKPGALLVNASRGGLIDEIALADALSAGQIGGAALDVFEEEPLGKVSPLRSAPNILLSPHAAWFSNVALPRLQQMAADEVARALRGQPPRCAVPA